MSTPWIEASDWQKIQNLFAKIIGTNLTLLDPFGRPLTAPSLITASCPEIALPLDSSGLAYDCLSAAIEKGFEKGKSFLCAHGLHFFGFDVHLKEGPLGTLVLGPVLIGKRDAEEVYRDLCRELKIQEENFLDRVREVKLFSHATMATVLDFMQEISGSFLNFTSQNSDLKRFLSGFLSIEPQGVAEFFSTLYSTQLTDFLMDMALGIVAGQSGSVLLLDKKDQHFYIKTARGISPEIVSKVRIPAAEGVVGWVAERGKPLLIQKDIPQDLLLKERLKKPQLYASFVVPIVFQDETLGVFCVNAESPNEKFNSVNLLWLDQLSRLASVAFGRLGA